MPFTDVDHKLHELRARVRNEEQQFRKWVEHKLALVLGRIWSDTLETHDAHLAPETWANLVPQAKRRFKDHLRDVSTNATPDVCGLITGSVALDQALAVDELGVDDMRAAYEAFVDYKVDRKIFGTDDPPPAPMSETAANRLAFDTLPVDTTLRFVSDGDVQCLKRPNGRVMFRGEEMSISLAAAKALGRETSGGVRGPAYWLVGDTDETVQRYCERVRYQAEKAQ